MLAPLERFVFGVTEQFEQFVGRFNCALRNMPETFAVPVHNIFAKVNLRSDRNEPSQRLLLRPQGMVVRRQVQAPRYRR